MKNINYNLLAKEIIGLLILSSILGLFFNQCSDKPYPLVYNPNDNLVSDSTLFGDLNDSSTTFTNDSLNNKESEADSLKKLLQQKNDSLKKANEMAKNKDSVPNSTLTTKDLEPKIVNYTQVTQLLKNPKVLFIDARPPDQYSESRIGNAINIFPYDAEDIILQKIISLPKDKTYIVYCHGGTCEDSFTLSKKMLSLDYKRVFVYKEGWNEWESKHTQSN